MQSATSNVQRRPRLSRDEFVQKLGDSGLWTRAEIDKNLKEVPGADSAADGNSLAELLASSGKLTNFQADAVWEQRYSDLVIGNYEVLDRLGAGGMGTVYKARHRRMKRVVGLKILAPELGKTPSFVQRFQREVEAVARLQHPNIVMAFDADEAEAGHFLVMEYVSGRDLASEVQERGPLPVKLAADCILQAARAMEYAHSQGIVHRDLKPANLLRDANGIVKVADLGLARINLGADSSADSGSGLTQAGGILGTVDYMPPEQALDSTSCDHRADIYSLGCTLHFLLTGKPMYPGATIVETLLKHRDAPIPWLRTARFEVSPELEAVFQKMVAKAPDDRFQSMAEVAKALEAIFPPAPPRSAQVNSQTVAGPRMDVTITGSPPSQLASPETVISRPQVAAEPAKISNVLLVEPSRTQSVIIGRYLQIQGIKEVVSVTSGSEALAVMRNSPPDVIISAMHLADITGVELAQKVREESQGRAPGFVLISSEAELSQVGSLSKCGRLFVLEKPFTLDKLAETLKLVSAKQSEVNRASELLGRGLRVLIVDDSAAARIYERDVLKSFGVTDVVEASDGAKAVAAVVGQAFDLIVTDYNMPYMDGLGLVGYLKQNPNTASIPIIMVTTEQDPSKLERVRQLGVAAVCDKSFPAWVVQDVLEQMDPRP